LVKQVGKVLAGTITPAGGLVKQVGKIIAGSITPSGALTALKVALLDIAGTITPAGALRINFGQGQLSAAPVSALGRDRLQPGQRLLPITQMRERRSQHERAR
jgi:uncharacterized membrane protein YgdD (TMEM256/DUF423 family)